ncbi:MAG: hypothetical protein NZ822_01480, partial [Patescibacteria group bacterium]|nr:hypothetical protein [Patescibacteria group bacterium]
MSKDVLKKNPLLVAIISSMVCSIVIISLGYLILERSYLSRKLNQDMKILEFFGKKHVAMVPPIREGIYSGDDLLLRVDESGNNILYVTGKMISMSERFIKNFDYVVFNNKILGPYDNVDGIYLTKDGRKYAYIVNSLNPKFVGKKREEVESEFFMYNPYDEAYVVVNGKQEFKYNKIQAFNWDEERGNYLYVGLSISKNKNEEPKCSIVYNGRIITSTVELVDPLSTCGGSFVSLSPDGKNFYYLAEITKENKRVLFFNDKKVEDFPYIL